MIGVFDSGSGGLTVLSAFRKRAPHADIVYFGDIAHAPYGEKSASQLADLTRQGVKILQEKGATSLISACNSVSASILAGAAGEMPFVEMSVPTAQHLSRYSGKRFLLIATPATIDSGLYTKAVKGEVALDSLAIANLAAAIEFDHSRDEIEGILRRAFSTRKGEAYEGLILGCTHYPLIQPVIERIASEYFFIHEIVDPAYPVAEVASKTFDTQGSGTTTFFTSQKSEAFENKVKSLFGEAFIKIL